MSTFYDQDAPENIGPLHTPAERLALRLGWLGCTMTNPLCPDDVCILAEGHSGDHMTACEIEPSPKDPDFFVMALPGSTLHDVIAIGRRKQDETWPEEAR